MGLIILDEIRLDWVIIPRSFIYMLYFLFFFLFFQPIGDDFSIFIVQRFSNEVYCLTHRWRCIWRICGGGGGAFVRLINDAHILNLHVPDKISGTGQKFWAML